MLIDDYLSEDTGSVWYSEYNRVATDLNIIRYGAGIGSVMRHDASVMIFRAYYDQLFVRDTSYMIRQKTSEEATEEIEDEEIIQINYSALDIIEDVDNSLFF